MTLKDDTWEDKSEFVGPRASPGFVFWNQFMTWQRGVNAVLAPYDITQPQFAILATCAWMTRDQSYRTQQDIADFLRMDRMHISQIINRLERKGLLARTTSPNDKRAKIVQLTEAGHVRLRETVHLVETFDKQFFQTPQAENTLRPDERFCGGCTARDFSRRT